MSECFRKIIRDRRSIYDLNKNINISDTELEKILEDCLRFAPSAYNSQSGRLCLMLNDHHRKLWQIVEDTLKEIVPAENFASTAAKIHSFSQAYGTILFFEDQKIIKDFQKNYPLYAQNFPTWSEQSSGILQYMVWTALAEQKIGASLQHYNPLIDTKVQKNWELPQNWQLKAQMPFGGIQKAPAEKTFSPVSERLKVFY